MDILEQQLELERSSSARALEKIQGIIEKGKSCPESLPTYNKMLAEVFESISEPVELFIGKQLKIGGKASVFYKVYMKEYQDRYEASFAKYGISCKKFFNPIDVVVSYYICDAIVGGCLLE